MALSTFPIPKKDPKYSFPNRFGIPPDIFNAIVKQAQITAFGTVEFVASSNFTPDASSATVFDLSLTAPNTTISAPTNPINGKVLLFRLRQTGLGSRLVTWDAIFTFSTSIPAPTLSTTTLHFDYVEFIYNGLGNRWDCIRVVTGFAP